MSIEALIAAVPPPTEPFEAYHGPWAPIESRLGTALPQDYKDFVRVYGSGYFMEFLGISVPESLNPNVRLQDHVEHVAAAFRADDEDLPFPIWPEPGGLIGVGTTDDGDELLWLAAGPPDEWRIVVWDRGFQTFEVLDCGLTDFLAGLATGDLAPGTFPTDLAYCDHLFQPSSRFRDAPRPLRLALPFRMSVGRPERRFGRSGGSLARLVLRPADTGRR